MRRHRSRITPRRRPACTGTSSSMPSSSTSASSSASPPAICAARAGWLLFALQVLAASLLMAVFLLWANAQFDWLALRARSGQRVLLLTGVLAGAAVLYFALLRVSGLGLRATLRR